MTTAAENLATRLPWEAILTWGGVLLVLYALHDFFPIVEQWFLTVKAPGLVAERRAAYLARLPAGIGLSPAGDLERRLGELALTDLDAQPAERARLVAQWESSSPAFRSRCRPCYSRTAPWSWPSMRLSASASSMPSS